MTNEWYSVADNDEMMLLLLLPSLKYLFVDKYRTLENQSVTRAQCETSMYYHYQLLYIGVYCCQYMREYYNNDITHIENGF